MNNIIKKMRELCALESFAVFLFILFISHSALAATVDGERAMALIRQQCNFGSRVPGSEAHKRCAAWIHQRLDELQLKAVDQLFAADLALSATRAQAVNIFGLPGEDGPTSPALIISAHWDTRPFADRDPSGANPAMLGANDGASGVALALELARALKGTTHFQQVVLLFHDAEDAGIQTRSETWCIGARYAASHAPPWIKRVRLGINLDLVGGSNAAFIQDAVSLRAAPHAIRALWEVGRVLAPRCFSADPAQQVIDDHLPWIESGVPFINLLGLPWEHWHTTNDKPENCSAATLQATGDALLEFIRSDAWLK